MKKYNRKTSLWSWKIWKWPVIVNLIATIGIAVALLGDYWLDGLSWVCLGSTVIYMIYAYQKK